LEVVDTVIARIKEVNPMVNAVVADRFEDARKDAANVDRILSSGSVPEELSEQNAPYLGVPFTAKEAVSVAGNVNYDPATHRTITKTITFTFCLTGLLF